MKGDHTRNENRPDNASEAPRGGRHSGLAATCRKWAPQLLVMAGLAPVNFALVIPRPVLKSMDAELGNSASGDLLIKMVIAIVGLSVVVGAPLAAVLIRRLGQRACMITFMALFAIAGCLPIFLNDLTYIVSSRAVLGFAVAGIQVSAVSLAGELYEEEKRARILGFMMAGASFAALILAPLAGLLGEFGWRNPFLLYLAGTPFILLAIFGLPRPPHGQEHLRPGPLSGSANFKFPYLLACVGFIGGAVMTLPPVYLAYRLGDIGVTSPAVVGISFIAVSVPEMICASFYGYLRQRYSKRFMCLLGFAFAATGLGLISLSPNYVGILVGMALYGPAIAFIYASILERASLSDQDRTRVVGVVVSAIFLSLVAGTFAAEPVFHAFGSSGVLMALAIACGLMIFALLARTLAARSAAETA